LWLLFLLLLLLLLLLLVCHARHMADNSQDDTRSCQGDTEKKAHLRPPPYMYFVALCASLNSVGLGYDVGVTSGVLIHLQEDLGFSAWEPWLQRRASFPMAPQTDLGVGARLFSHSSCRFLA